MGALWILAGLIVLAVVYALVMKSRSENQAANSGGMPVSAAASVSPVIQAGIEEETVAAIMAAISCMTESDSGVRYAVKSISRAKSERPVWGFAGIQQNTRSF